MEAGNRGVAYTDPFGLRPLTDAEKKALGDECKKIDCNRVAIFDGHDDAKSNKLRAQWLRLTGGRSITVGHNIIIGDADLNDKGYATGAALAHEMTHVGQLEAWGPARYSVVGLTTQIYNTVGNWLGKDNPAYQVPLPINKPFASYGMEQQATIVEQCFNGVQAYCAASPYTFPRP